MCPPTCRSLLLLSFFHLLLASEEEHNFGQLYSTAKEAYLDNDWPNCVKHMNAAIRGYRAHRDIVIECRRECRKMSQSPSEKDSVIFVGDPELGLFERVTREALCLMDCKGRRTGGKLPRGDEIASGVTDDFERKKPYDYLQLCYYQVCIENEIEPHSVQNKAVSSLIRTFPDETSFRLLLDSFSVNCFMDCKF